MSRLPTKYTPEFKLRVVKEVIEQSKRPSAVAREHKILPSTLFAWRMLYTQQGERAFLNPVQEVPSQNSKVQQELELLRTREIVYERLLGRLTLENYQLREQLNA